MAHSQWQRYGASDGAASWYGTRNGLKVSGVAHAYNYDRKTLAELLMATAEPVLLSEFVACLAMTGFRSLQTAYLQNTIYESWTTMMLRCLLLTPFGLISLLLQVHSQTISSYTSCSSAHHTIFNHTKTHDLVSCSLKQGVLATRGLGSRSKSSPELRIIFA